MILAVIAVLLSQGPEPGIGSLGTLPRREVPLHASLTVFTRSASLSPPQRPMAHAAGLQPGSRPALSHAAPIRTKGRRPSRDPSLRSQRPPARGREPGLRG